jgi:uncharacterized membrane protein
VRQRALRPPSTSRTRLLVSFATGTLAGWIGSVIGADVLATLVGWDVAALTFIVWSWLAEWKLDAAATATHAVRQNPGRAIADTLFLFAAVASLSGVAAVIVAANTQTQRVLAAAVALGSVVLSWTLVHTLYAARYATMFYAARHGVEFNEPIPPRYSDFAYLSFTIGMTFQVSDTDLTNKEIRAVVLRHALLAYSFGAVILAATINLVAGLAASKP